MITKCPPLFPKFVLGEDENNKQKTEENKQQWDKYLAEKEE